MHSNFFLHMRGHTELLVYCWNVVLLSFNCNPVLESYQWSIFIKSNALKIFTITVYWSMHILLLIFCNVYFNLFSFLQVVTLQEAKLLLKEDDDLIIAVYDYWLNKRLRLVSLIVHHTLLYLASLSLAVDNFRFVHSKRNFKHGKLDVHCILFSSVTKILNCRVFLR